MNGLRELRMSQSSARTARAPTGIVLDETRLERVDLRMAQRLALKLIYTVAEVATGDD
jgi:hypothetical protein